MPKFKDVVGYEGYYEVSDDGKIRSCRSGKYLTQTISKAGYFRVSLSVNGKYRKAAVHRLVAEAFIDNPERKATVNHKNEIKTDNRIQNLEWATNAEQNVYGTRIERARSHTDYKARKIDYKQVASKHDYEAIAEKCRTPIYQLDLNGNVINRFCSIKDAATALKVSAGHICDCLRGKRGKTGGFKWAYAN